MQNFTGIGRKNLVIFVVGLSLGFMVTYLILTSRLVTEDKLVNRPVSAHFIPDKPHSHGETDHFVGPDKAQSWKDFDAEGHTDEDDRAAKQLYKEVRVLCWVMTSPSNIRTKARHVKATWGKRCNVLLFMSSEEDKTLPAIGLPVHEGRDFLWHKTKEAFKYVHAHHMDDADWYLKADDDTYVVLENLRHMLHAYDPNEPVYFGRRFKPYVRQGYMSGGAGYVLSKQAMKKFVEVSLKDPLRCKGDEEGVEDLEMGVCLQNVGIKPGDSRDLQGRERFHPFIPEHHLIPGLVPRDNWYWSYNYYPAKEGPDCCSDYAITFHYVPPNMMYVFEYMIYHLKPYGINSKIILPPKPDDEDSYVPPNVRGDATDSHSEAPVGRIGQPEVMGRRTTSRPPPVEVKQNVVDIRLNPPSYHVEEKSPTKRPEQTKNKIGNKFEKGHAVWDHHIDTAVDQLQKPDESGHHHVDAQEDPGVVDVLDEESEFNDLMKKKAANAKQQSRSHPAGNAVDDFGEVDDLDSPNSNPEDKVRPPKRPQVKPALGNVEGIKPAVKSLLLQAGTHDSGQSFVRKSSTQNKESEVVGLQSKQHRDIYSRAHHREKSVAAGRNADLSPFQQDKDLPKAFPQKMIVRRKKVMDATGNQR